MYSKLSSGGTLLASMPVRVITYATVIEITTVILVSYTISVAMGHVPLWLPMISDCAVKAPEMFIFRYGMLVGASILACNFLVVYSATKASYRHGAKLCLALGMVASFCFGLLTAVNEDEISHVHGVAAGLFFVCYLVYMIITSYYGHFDPRVSKSSLNVKRITTIIEAISIFTLAALSSDWSKHHTAIAVCEWTAVAMIQVFNFSFVKDLAGTRLDEVGSVGVTYHVKLQENFV